MINLPLNPTNLPAPFATSCTKGGVPWRVYGRLLQLVVMPSDAYLCGKHKSIAGMAASFKTFPKEVTKKRVTEEEKAIRDNNRDNLPYLSYLPWDPRRRRAAGTRHSLTPTGKASSPETTSHRHIIPSGGLAHPLEAGGAGPGQRSVS
jgi:hypothetical protein